MVYLRALIEPARARLGYASSVLFPLLSQSQIGPFLAQFKIELVREAATIVMLAAVALAAVDRARGWLAAFAVVFGAWDLAFYVFLRVLIGWPASVWNWDLLFLLPVPWSAPVMAPAVIAASLVAGGIVGMVRAPSRVGWATWGLLLSGGAVVFAAFIWNWRGIVAGGVPAAFPWAIFWIGEMAGVGGLVWAVKGR